MRRDRNDVAVFFGGAALSSAPDLLLQPAPDAKIPGTATGGDFNGDGLGDVAVVYQGGSSSVAVYFGSEVPDGRPDHVVRYEALLPNLDMSYREITLVANLGDINGDGVDDLGLTAPFANIVDETSGEKTALNSVFVLFGGTTLSSTPDVRIDYEPVETGGYEGTGGLMTGLGDINGDDLDDFAVAATFRQNESGAYTGVVYIHFGRRGMARGATPFGIPDITLEPSTGVDARYEGFGSGVAAGDFNGDGHHDIAVIPYHFYETGGSRQGVPEAVHVFYGGPTFDDREDLLLRLPGDAFGRPDVDLLGANAGNLLFLLDMDENGADELLLASGAQGLPFGYGPITNAAIYMGGASPEQVPSRLLLAPNAATGLDASAYNAPSSAAVGDFDRNGRLDVVLVQYQDNNDAYQSSRVYRYELGSYTATSIASEEGRGAVPAVPHLAAAFPNPFRHTTQIAYTLPEAGHVRLEVFDLLGRRVQTLVDEQQAPGAYAVKLDAHGLASGMYFCKLQASASTETRRLVLAR